MSTTGLFPFHRLVSDGTRGIKVRSQPEIQFKTEALMLTNSSRFSSEFEQEPVKHQKA